MTVLHAGKTLTVTLEQSILDVVLHRDPCNEIGTHTLADLEVVAKLAHDVSLGARAMVMHSSVTRGFCAGADLRELYSGLIQARNSHATDATIAAEVRGFIDRIHATFDALDCAPIVTVAATHGVVFGGGFELALTADVVVADKSTRFCFPELRLGIVPGFGGIPRLERDCGNAIVRDLLLTGRSLNATRAHEIGLVTQLVAKGEALGVARAVAQQAVRFDKSTVTRAKAFLKRVPTDRLEQEKSLFCEMILSPVVQASLRKFVESTDVRPYLP